MKATMGILTILLSSCALTPQQSSSASNEDLCSNLALTGSQPARTELLRRKALTMDEMRLANAERVEVGMRSLVVICSLGRPSRVKRTSDTREEWHYAKLWRWLIYNPRRFQTILLENGVVTDVQ